MIDRRTALKLSTAGMFSGLMNISGQALAKPSKKIIAIPSQVVFNSQYLESRFFAETFESYSVFATDIKDSLSNLWYQNLRYQLMAERKPVFGLTDRRDLFCLEELARDVGMKVNLRIDHLIHQNGFVEHKLNGSPLMGSPLENLGHISSFGDKMAKLAELLLNDQTLDISAQKLTGPYAPADKTALVTWVIS